MGQASSGMKKGRQLCLIKIVKNDVTYKKGLHRMRLMASYAVLFALINTILVLGPIRILGLFVFSLSL